MFSRLTTRPNAPFAAGGLPTCDLLVYNVSMSYKEQKQFFETAYRTGSDIWTDKHYHSKVFEYLKDIPDGATVLDLGTGRGRWPFTMAEMGMKVIGLDYIKELIDVNNSEAKAKHFEGHLAFALGDALDIRFTDESFDAVTDFGLLQHMHREDWAKYGSEVKRVLRNGGYYLCVALSKDTEKFYDFSPSESTDGDFEKYGVYYHFFSPEDMSQVFGADFKVIKTENLFIEKYKETLLFTLLQKNSPAK